MSTIEHVTLSELQDFLQSLQLPPDTRLTVKIENGQTVQKADLSLIFKRFLN